MWCVVAQMAEAGPVIDVSLSRRPRKARVMASRVCVAGTTFLSDPSQPQNAVIAALHECFHGAGMAEKGCRACRQPICAGLKDNHQVADVRMWQLPAIAQQIERRAETANDRDNFRRRRGQLVADRQRIIAPDDLTEIARSRELMMQPAIGHEKNLPTRFLTVDHARNVNASF